MKIKSHFFAQIAFSIIFFLIFGSWLMVNIAFNQTIIMFNGAGYPLKFNAI